MDAWRATLLVEALGRMNAQERVAYLILAGQGAERPWLERLALQHGIHDKVRFLGLQQDVRAAQEAMSMERPVVLTAAGGAAEMVEHGQSGLLFETGNVEALTELRLRLYDSSELRQKLGAAARRRVLARFRFEDMIGHYRMLMLL